MRVIARIPDIAQRAEAAPSHGGRVPAPARGRHPSRPRPSGRLPSSLAGARTSWPVAVLAVLAVAAWMLASWQDQTRLRRQRGDTRLAREPAAAPAAVPAATSTGGVVVR